MPLVSIPSSAKKERKKERKKSLSRSQAWWRMLVIPVLWEAETGGSVFAASLSSFSLSLSLSLSLST